MYKISIIIPIYNVEKYLPICINSILNQTFKDFELILVDDGSTDSSGKLCDEYAKQYKNIVVIHKKNSGPSDARNEGIKIAKGDYLTYIDSDDYVTNDCLETLLRLVINYDADISGGNFGFFSNHYDIPSSMTKKQYKNKVYNGVSACKDLLYEKLYSSSCCLLIKKEIAKSNLFPSKSYHEDEMTTFRYYLNANKVVITNKVLYYYFQRPGSIMHSFGLQIRDEIVSANYYVDYVDGKSKDLVSAAMVKKFSLYCRTLENYPEIKNTMKDLYSDIILYLRSNKIDILLNFSCPLTIKIKALKY